MFRTQYARYNNILSSNKLFNVTKRTFYYRKGILGLATVETSETGVVTRFGEFQHTR